MKYIMSIVRGILGWIIRFLDWMTRPEPMKRPEDEQEQIEAELESLAVYEFDG